MRIYKAIIDEDYNLVSYEEPKDDQTIFCRQKQYTFTIDLDTLKEYLEYNGYITTYKGPESMVDFVMYLDIDYKFHTIWNNDTSIFVLDQIKRKLREEMCEEMSKNGLEIKDKSYIHLFPSIVGPKELKVGDIVHLSHKSIHGLWESSNEDVATIDRHTGLVTTKIAGSVVMIYVCDTGLGITKSFHKITIKK